MKTKKYAISDIHGCAITFQELLNKIGYSKEDELILLGDYINKGPNSKKVIDTIIDLQNNGYKVTALKGNHEEMIFDSIELEEWTAGAEETLKSFNISHFNQLSEKYIKWFSKLKTLSVDHEYVFVHAGLNFENDNPLDDLHAHCWIRDWYKSIDYDWLGNRKIIHGHVPQKKHEIEKMLQDFSETSLLDIDNGCHLKGEVGFGNLCCVELSNLKLTFQQNID
ncbi:MAG: metallophosphoesterase family protein [Cyclobacteriaceae bacterium]